VGIAVESITLRRMTDVSAAERFLVDGEWVDAAETRRRVAGQGLPDRMHRTVPLVEGHSVVDIGCYSGEFVAELLRRDPAWDVVGLDYDEEGLKLARLLHPELASRYRRSSVYDLDLPDESVDCVTFQEVIEHLEGPAVAVKEINRVLRPGGVLVVTTPNAYALSHFVAFARSELVRRARRQRPALADAVFYDAWEWNRHVYCWTPSTLLTLLQVNGFAYDTHTYAADAHTIWGRVLHRTFPFLGTEIILRVRKVAAAARRIV
jgi:2-polyprenyl-3-methyl-5-hydroxy-6-metoxy-1,4-benzoquinol methylase